MTEPLKVLQVSHGYPPAEQAGAELCCAFLSQELRRLGQEVSVWTATREPEVPDFTVRRESVAGVPVARLKLPADSAGSLRDTWQNDWVARELRAELKSGFDVVHFHHLLGLSTDLVELAKESGAAVVLTLHDFWYLCPRGQRFTPRGHLCADIEPWRCSLCIAKKRVRYAWNALAGRTADPARPRGLGPALRRPLAALGAAARYLPANLHRRPILERRDRILDQLGRADLVLAPSRFVLDEYQRHGLRAARTEVSENGMDVQWALEFPVREAPHRPMRFGYLGSFLPSKGVDLAVEAFQALPAGAAELHLHGTSPWDGGRFAARVEAGNRHPGVHFHGPFPHERLAEVLGAIDVLVVPSRWYENAPLTLDEAALARIPVVAAGHGGMQEITERRGNGLLFQPGDAADLRRALLRLAEDPGLWSELREPKAPVRTVREQAEEMIGRYRELVGG